MASITSGVSIQSCFSCMMMKCTSLIGILTILLLTTTCSSPDEQSWTTIADARESPAQFIDTGEPGDSVGDILVFDQPLLDGDKKPIGNNSGICIRTRVAHSFQCQWTLTTDNGSVQVAGREFDSGTSTLSIVGGTGIYRGINGEMESTNNNDGTFTQVLHYRLAHRP